jgi:hypothetical protein
MKGIRVALIELISMCSGEIAPFGSVSVSDVRSAHTAIHSRPSALRESARRQSDKAHKRERASGAHSKISITPTTTTIHF